MLPQGIFGLLEAQHRLHADQELPVRNGAWQVVICAALQGSGLVVGAGSKVREHDNLAVRQGCVGSDTLKNLEAVHVRQRDIE